MKQQFKQKELNEELQQCTFKPDIVETAAANQDYNYYTLGDKMGGGVYDRSQVWSLNKQQSNR